MASSQTEEVVLSECLPGVSSNATSQCGLKSSSSITRQASIYSFTLEEFQNVLGEPAKSFGSMNMDEFLKNIWTVEESQAMAAAMGSGSGALNRQASMSLPRTLSQKTVDDVWKDIARDSMGMGSDPMAATAAGSQDRQFTFGEMTLEDFLVKAGVVKKDDPGMASDMPLGMNVDKGFRPAAGNRPSDNFMMAGSQTACRKGRDQEKVSDIPANRGGLEPMQIEPMNNASPVTQQLEWLSNNGFKVEVPQAPSLQNRLHQHALESSGRKEILGNSTMAGELGSIGPDLGAGLFGGAVPACNSPTSLVNPKTGSPQSPFLEGLGPPYDALGMHSPLPYGGLEGGIVRGRKRDFEGSLEKVVERRQKRMIKNRESAARSRARKQAYTVELEAEVSHLKEENMKLRQYEEDVAECRKKQLIDLITTCGSHYETKSCELRRAQTGPW